MSLDREKIRADVQQTVERFQQLPKIARWGFYAAVALVALLVWNDLIRPQVVRMNDRARDYEARIEALRNAPTMVAQVGRLKDTIISVGEVTTPRTPSEGEGALNNAVNDVLSRHSVSNDTFRMRPGGNLPRDAMMSLTGGAEAQRLTGVLTFDAAAEDAMAIIAELESKPEIEVISATQLTRLPNRRLAVYMEVEAWVLSQDGGARSPRARMGI